MFIEKQTCSQGRLKESDYELRESSEQMEEGIGDFASKMHRILEDFIDRGINPELFLSYLLLYFPWSINTYSLENLSPVPFVTSREYS